MEYVDIYPFQSIVCISSLRNFTSRTRVALLSKWKQEEPDKRDSRILLSLMNLTHSGFRLTNPETGILQVVVSDATRLKLSPTRLPRLPLIAESYTLRDSVNRCHGMAIYTAAMEGMSSESMYLLKRGALSLGVIIMGFLRLFFVQEPFLAYLPLYWNVNYKRGSKHLDHSQLNASVCHKSRDGRWIFP